jgi:hypothetical protein
MIKPAKESKTEELLERLLKYKGKPLPGSMLHIELGSSEPLWVYQ